ncbi:MAG: methyl-accepting chemotaxis protein, partial [Betaproteobacteria bacterium]
MNFSNLKVGTRLAAGFGLILFLLLVVAGVGVNSMATMKADLDGIVLEDNVEIGHLLAMRLTVYERAIALRNIALLTETSELAAEVERIGMSARKYAESEAALTRMHATFESTSAQSRTLLLRIKEREVVANPLMAQVMEHGLAHKPELAIQVLVKELRPVTKKWGDALDTAIALETKNSDVDAANAIRTYFSARTIMLVLAGLTLLLGTGAAVFIVRGLQRQLGGEPAYAAEIAGKVAQGDLSVSIVTRQGDTTSLLAALATMRDSLGRIVGAVRASTESIGTTAREIATGNQDLSQRTEEQASSLEETASSMAELMNTVKQTADNARQANQLAGRASEVAVRGGSVVGEVVTTMGAINDSSRKIADIIGVIDGIAFQTNILALNAAVEAARAGEQGRGFAVVAAEVRNLAQRSAAAAKEIKALIEDSVHKVDAGAKLVDEAGKTMAEVVGSITRVTDVMAEIAAASSEQSTGIEQVNQAVMQIDHVTLQNAALVE